MGIFDKLFGSSKVRELKNKKDVEGLIKILQLHYDDDGGDWNAKKDAIEALGEIGDARAVKPLIQYLRRELPWGMPAPKDAAEGMKIVRSDFKVCDAFVEIGAPAVNPLIQILKESTSSGKVLFRERVIGALLRIGVDIR